MATLTKDQAKAQTVKLKKEQQTKVLVQKTTSSC
jgi:hypothetical protein